MQPGCLLLLWSAHVVGMVSPGVLYPYGSEEGDTRTCPEDDMFTGPVSVEPFPFMDKLYTKLYVNSNPILSLGRPFLEYTPENFPISSETDDTNYFQLLQNGEDCVSFANFSSANLSSDYYGLLAVFWSDADPSANSPVGSIFYRLITNDTILHMMGQDVKLLYPVDEFDPAWAFILTYSDITYYLGSTDTDTNTMQIAISSDGSLTFVLYNYERVEWPNNESTFASKSLVGFASSDSYCQVAQSMTDDIVDLPQLTNVDMPGRWVLRVDQPGLHDNNCFIKMASTTGSVYTSVVTERTSDVSYAGVTVTAADATSTEGLAMDTSTEGLTMDITSSTISTQTSYEITSGDIHLNQTVTTIWNSSETVETTNPNRQSTEGTTTEGRILITTPSSTQQWSYGFQLEFACAPFPSWFDIQTHAISVEYGDKISYWCKDGYEFSDRDTRKYSLCSSTDKTWQPYFMECQKIINAEEESEYEKPVEAEKAIFIGTFAVIFMFLEFLVMFLVDIPVWISIFKDWFDCCHYYLKRLKKKRSTHKPNTAKVSSPASDENSKEKDTDLNVHSLNLI